MAAKGMPRFARSSALERTVDGITFPSKPEVRRYLELKQLKREGQVRTFLRQVPFHFPDDVWRCDFFVLWEDGHWTVEDVKAKNPLRHSAHERKMKLMKKYYPEFLVTILYR